MSIRTAALLGELGMDGADRVGGRRVGGGAGRAQVGGADHDPVQARGAAGCRAQLPTPSGDSIMPITRVSAVRRSWWAVGSTWPYRPAREYVAKPRWPERGVVRRVDQRARPGPRCRCAGRRSRRRRRPGPAAPGPARRLPTRTSVGTAVRRGDRQVLAQRDQVGRAVLAVDQHEVEARHRAHLDQLLGRHPQQHPQQAVAVCSRLFSPCHSLPDSSTRHRFGRC